jgi:hypothetical protein
MRPNNKELSTLKERKERFGQLIYLWLESSKGAQKNISRNNG